MLISALDNGAHTGEDWRVQQLTTWRSLEVVRLGAICQASVDKDNANQKWEVLYIV